MENVSNAIKLESIKSFKSTISKTRKGPDSDDCERF